MMNRDAKSISSIINNERTRNARQKVVMSADSMELEMKLLANAKLYIVPIVPIRIF